MKIKKILVNTIDGKYPILIGKDIAPRLKNILDKKAINKQLNEEDILKTNFTDIKDDTTKKEKRDFSRNIKYVND